MTTPFNFNPPAALEFALEAERFYAGLVGLVSEARPGSAQENDPGLGGKLLYAGELDARTRALVAAANIAGAATLAVTADPAAQKQAIRDGVVDFVVNSLDEALRILKNQIRKRETVAVCVAAAPEAVESEMLERGVRADLLGPGGSADPESAALFPSGIPRIEAAGTGEGEVFVAWRVAAAPALWLPKVDRIAGDCLPPAAWAARRWLRLAPRFLGRLAAGVRLLRVDEPTAQRFLKRVGESVERGEIGVPVEIQSVAPPAASIRAQSSFTP